MLLHQFVEFTLTNVAEGRVPHIVREADSFGQVGIDVEAVVEVVGAGAQVFADRAADFCDFDGVGEPCAVEIVFAGLEDLGLGLEPTEGVGENDSVALDLKGVAIIRVRDGSLRKALKVKGVVEFVFHSVLACLPQVVSLQQRLTSIMKYPKASFVFSAICAGLIMTAFSSTAEARIGERRESVERRLFSSGGIMYRDDVVEASRRKGMPYLKYLELMSSSTDVRVYYKTADGRRPSSKELEEKRVLPGWDLHVLYVDGKSAIEVYKRSQGMTDYELNQLLTIQAQGSFWKKVEKKAKVEGEEPSPSAFGYEMELDNGSIRAKKVGNGLMIFDTRIDIMLATVQDSDQQENAPISLNGF
ncbi:MAG: hypothetical protein ACI8Z5_001131 [Lentimonas sp.]